MDWQRFDQHVSGAQRVNAVLDWLRRPADIRPAFVTLYFDIVDTAGHRFGPDSAEVNTAIGEVDARIGDLVAGLAAMRQPAHLLIVADHGMRAVDASRVIQLADLIDRSEEHTSELQSLMRISYAVFCLKNKSHQQLQ